MQTAKGLMMGSLMGIALHSIAALALSYALRLGYYLPYFANLPEQVGGELNAVLVQMALAAVLGALTVLGYRLLKRWMLRNRDARRGRPQVRRTVGSAQVPVRWTRAMHRGA